MRTFILIVVGEDRRISVNYLNGLITEITTAAEIVGQKYAKQIEEMSMEIYIRVLNFTLSIASRQAAHYLYLP